MNSEDFQKELVKDFILESFEGLDTCDQELLSIEKGESSKESLNNIFRVIHSIKGTAGCLGFSRIEKASHKGEDLMTLIRDGQLPANEPRITALLSLSDAIRDYLGQLENNGSEGDSEYEELLLEIESLTNASGDTEALDSEPQTEVQIAAEPTSDSEIGFGFFDDEPVEETPVSMDEDSSSATFGFFVPVDDELESQQTKPEPQLPHASASFEKDTKNKKSLTETAIRIDVSHLDKVMDIVGELVLARNQILLNTATFDKAALLAASQRLNIITTELQENVMKTRMQPIRNVWGKFPRVVRDLSNELGKKVKLVMDGQDTELDRTIIEAIKDPLIHIVRNAVDHGIEDPDTRLASSKPAEGLISMRAFHEGGQVNIEIMDDGAGIRPESVLKKAVSKSLITSAEAERLSSREIINLIFQPGFSTAEKISNVSGRGVGMDVVKTNVEKIGGSVDLQSEIGQGSIIKIKIPLTLAIIPALLVSSGGDRYAIPQVNLLELVRLDPEKTSDRIEYLDGTPVLRLRGRLLPIIDLNEQLQVESCRDQEDLVTNIVVLKADEQEFGLVVDSINDTEEIVVKPLGKQLKGLTCYAGATILGDGKVALILDAMGIAQHSHVVSDIRSKKSLGENKETELENSGTQSMLIFELADGRRMALPLSLASRLEEFEMSEIEWSGNQAVIQYRERILPLVDVSRELGSACQSLSSNRENPLQVIVYSDTNREVGLVVEKILDIVDTEAELSVDSNETGVLGSTIIRGKVTDLIDAERIAGATTLQSRSRSSDSLLSL